MGQQLWSAALRWETSITAERNGRGDQLTLHVNDRLSPPPHTVGLGVPLNMLVLKGLGLSC